jgi:hypothetical protein
MVLPEMVSAIAGEVRENWRRRRKKKKKKKETKCVHEVREVGEELKKKKKKPGVLFSFYFF